MGNIEDFKVGLFYKGKIDCILLSSYLGLSEWDIQQYAYQRIDGILFRVEIAICRKPFCRAQIRWGQVIV